MHFVTDKLSERGGRPINEDACDYATVAGRAYCWVLADGLGGHGGGERASRLAVEHVLAAFHQHPTLAPDTLHTCLEAAQHAILTGQHHDLRFSEMRTTVVILLSDGQAALWAHVGDSRLYFLRAGRVIFQTRDHSVPQALADGGEISPKAIRHHEDRNRLLRSLGTETFRPEIASQPVLLEAGDAFLLCSDGFWEYVLETEMEVDLAKSSTATTWLARMKNRLLQRVGPKPDNKHDNYSAIAVLAEK